MLKNSLISYLHTIELDDDVVKLFQHIRALQTNGIQISDAISQACEIEQSTYYVKQTDYHVDNVPSFLAIRYRARLLKYRAEGYGYGTIAKMFAKRGTYNKNTKKAYSRTSIKRAIQLLEESKK